MVQALQTLCDLLRPSACQGHLPGTTRVLNLSGNLLQCLSLFLTLKKILMLSQEGCKVAGMLRLRFLVQLRVRLQFLEGILAQHLVHIVSVG